jgi:long-chain acyl-CoA synthetase
MTHPRLHALRNPGHPAVIMSDDSATLTYGELERQANQGAQLFRSLGVKTGDTIAVWLPNLPDFHIVYWAAQRAGLYITPVATALTADEARYIVENSGAKLLVSCASIEGLSGLRDDTPASLLHIYDLVDWRAAIAPMPDTPIADEKPGFHMVYSSGTTGRPKGIRLPLPTGDVTDAHMLAERAAANYGVGPGTVYLSPAPLYHTAPLAFTTSCHRLGATVIVMPKFDAEDALKAIARHQVTVTQMVPTMFVRMLKLPDAVRLKYDVSSLQHVIHAAAPCPIDTKRAMIEWLGPIVQEYYGGSEGNGSTNISATEWLKKPGSVGKASWGTIHICDDDGTALPPGAQGNVYFEGGWDFQYLGDPEKTRDSRHPVHSSWSSLGDIGYLDADGYLFLTDRKSHMIISGGVNIYPQEVENLLITHPKVADAAVIGVPNADFGEEVKAVVQPVDWADATPEFAADLIDHCRAHLSAIKCPRSVDFDAALPRLDNGKLYKRLVKDRYWQGHEKRV